LAATITVLSLYSASAQAQRKDVQAADSAVASTKIVTVHTKDRFDEARKVNTVTGTIVPIDPQCLPLGTKRYLRHIELDWDSGGISPSRVDYSGPVCFELHSFNDILYTPSFTLTEKIPSGSAIDLLKDAISTVTGFSVTGEAKSTSPGLETVTPCQQLSQHVANAQAQAALFESALSQLDPGKDNNGKINLVPLATSLQKWQPIPARYQNFQAVVSNVVADLNLSGADACDPKILGLAESIVIDAYLPIQQNYPVLAAHAASPHIARFTADLEETSAYNLAVTAIYPSGDVSNGTKTFSLSAGHKILSSSGGFLITELPARSYSSVTAPTGMTNPATQSVLGVDFRNGPRVALAALLNVYIPNWKRLPLNRRAYGLALSAGPVFDISNGKADTSHFGFFAGPTLHIRNQFFLTPGVHIGEFADFPIGFTGAGQVIPSNIGTPAAVKRYSARFAFAVTYKIKDFGETTTKSSVDTKSGGTGQTAK